MSLPPTVHATAVAIGGAGVLIRGPAGSGKSSLALALLSADPAGTRLVADDRVALAVVDGLVVASAPASLAGLLEVRWVGILPFRHAENVPIRLVVDLVAPAEAARLPEPADASVVVAGVAVRRIGLPAGLADAALRVRAALGALR